MFIVSDSECRIVWPHTVLMLSEDSVGEKKSSAVLNNEAGDC